MEHTLVLATRNEGKIRELAELVAPYGLKILGLHEFGEIGDIEENGATFAQNALIKARFVAENTHHIALADDSGLEVDALNGRPGIYSARYSNDWEMLPNENQDQRNIRKLLYEMEGVPMAMRRCRFVTSMACVRPDGRELSIEAHWEGQLLTKARGENGFGYDPIFLILKSAGVQLNSPVSRKMHAAIEARP